MLEYRERIWPTSRIPVQTGRFSPSLCCEPGTLLAAVPSANALPSLRGQARCPSGIASRASAAQSDPGGRSAFASSFARAVALLDFDTRTRRRVIPLCPSFVCV